MWTVRVALSSISLSLALTIALAPAASAQVPPLPDPDAVVADVGAAAGGVLGGATSTVEKTVSQTSDTVDDTVSEATETVSKTAEPLSDQVKETVNSTTGTIKEPLKPVLDKVGEIVPGAGHLLPGEITGDAQGDDKGSNQPGGPGRGHDREGARVRGIRTAATADRGIDLGGITAAISSATRIQASSSRPAEQSLLQQAGEAAIQGIVRVAFPLLLALLVAAFIAFQGRVGRNDPKLLLAPLDPEQTSLTFR